ncbi:hypothetical protein JTB14_011361 [Gonioctena quinquepunctata]|nr:hypothetical protein JTB14_011361 [Gonioctena quinquepunctata]
MCDVTRYLPLILPKNVDKVIETLQKRFRRPEYSINTLLEKFKNIPSVREDKINNIVEFSDTVGNLVNTIQTLNQEDHLRNPVLLQDLIYKLPIRLRMEWVRESKDLLQSDLKLVKFQEWLENVADDVCQLQNPFPSNSKYEQNKVGSLNILILQLKLPKRQRDVFSAIRKITICQNVAHFQI